MKDWYNKKVEDVLKELNSSFERFGRLYCKRIAKK